MELRCANRRQVQTIAELHAAQATTASLHEYLERIARGVSKGGERCG